MMRLRMSRPNSSVPRRCAARRRFEQITDTDLVRVFWSEHARHQRPQYCDGQDHQADDDLLLPANAPQSLP